MISETKNEITCGKDFKMLMRKHILQRFSIALAQIKACNMSEKFDIQNPKINIFFISSKRNY